jgi:uncharacterized protein with ATP-grasp and redox domains
MRVYLDCFPCFLRQTLAAARFVTDDEAIHAQVAHQVLELLRCTDARQTPPAIGQQIHRLIRKVTGDSDPYQKKKRSSNQLALGLYPQLKDKIRGSATPLETAVRLAIAGNVIDFGICHSLDAVALSEAIDSALADEWNADLLGEFAQAVNDARDILFIGDNAGEIMFDRLLIEELPCEKVTYVVKGAPVINDATREDAAMVGMIDLVEVIDNGSDAPGTLLDDCSAEFRRRFEESDLVLAKGQANYESLSGIDKDMFFILKAKCPVLAADLGCEMGQMILRRSKIADRVVHRGRKEQTDARL